VEYLPAGAARCWRHSQVLFDTCYVQAFIGTSRNLMQLTLLPVVKFIFSTIKYICAIQKKNRLKSIFSGHDFKTLVFSKLPTVTVSSLIQLPVIFLITLSKLFSVNKVDHKMFPFTGIATASKLRTYYLCRIMPFTVNKDVNISRGSENGLLVAET